MQKKKIIIDKWKLNEKVLFSCYENFAYRMWLSVKGDSARDARKRKKLVKIILNWKMCWYHLFDQKNKTLFIETKWNEDITIYTDQ